MRIRLPFAGKFIQREHPPSTDYVLTSLFRLAVFFLLLLLAGYAGLTSLQIDVYVNDKVLHLFTFFALTVAFYWIVDTNRRRTLNLTLIICTICLGVGSEFLQNFLPNGRDFDLYDILANVVGSLAALGLCSLYHKRMVDRKRKRKQYNVVPGEDTGEDLELGEGVGGGHEEGVIESSGPAGGGHGERAGMTEEDVDNWDEPSVDVWNENDLGDVGTSKNVT